MESDKNRVLANPDELSLSRVSSADTLTNSNDSIHLVPPTIDDRNNSSSSSFPKRVVISEGPLLKAAGKGDQYLALKIIREFPNQKSERYLSIFIFELLILMFHTKLYPTPLKEAHS
jgi:hypothetical protein